MSVNIKEVETIFLSGLSLFPELLFAYSDLKDHHFSALMPKKLYRAMINEDEDSLIESGVFGLALRLRKEDKISSEEWQAVVDNYDLPDYMMSKEYIQTAYEQIKESRYLEEMNSQIIEVMKDDFYESKISSIRKIADMHEDNKSGIKLNTLQEIETDYINKKASGDFFGVLSYGFPQFDNVSDIMKNHLIVIAARPSVGKSTYVAYFMLKNSFKRKGVFITMEMSKYEIFKKIADMRIKYNEDNLLILERPSISINSIANLIIKHSPDYVVIDQLNKISSQGNNLREKFSNSMIDLKRLAMRLSTPIVVVAQIGRSGEDEPKLSSLKESGSIEEEADKVILIHRDKDDWTNKTTFILAKNRGNNDGRFKRLEVSFDTENQVYSGFDGYEKYEDWREKQLEKEKTVERDFEKELREMEL